MIKILKVPQAGFGAARAPVLSVLFLMFGLCAELCASPLPLPWRADWPNCKPVEKLVHRGSDVALQPTFYINGLAADTNGWTFSTFVQTNAVGEWFGPLPGAFFSHTNDVGASFYNVMVRAETPGGSVNYTAFARFRMLDSPGFTPGELPLPAKVIDFADVTVLNPPWGEGGGGSINAATATNIATAAAANATNTLVHALTISRYDNDSIHVSYAKEAYYAESSDSAYRATIADKATDAVDSENTAALWSDSRHELRTVEEVFDQIDAATTANAAQSAQITAIGAHLNAEDARFVSTNYNSETRMAEAYVEVLVSNNWLTVWREMTRWNWFLGIYTNQYAATVAALANKSEKEYAFYDGVTGEPAPDGFFWISQPRIAIAAGMSYQSYVDSSGAVWVLESNGMVTDLNGTTNGYFRISDDEGNSQFEIVKGSARTVGAVAGAFARTEVMGVTHWHTTYAVTNAATAPVAMYARDLTSGEWYSEADADCPCNVSWTSPDPGTYICEWWPKSAEPMMFMKAEYGQGSETRIRQVAPVEMQTIVIGGVKYSLGTTTINGVAVLTATPAN